MKQIVFLISGNGGHLKYFLRSIDVLQLPIVICGVIADRDCGALEFARQNGIRAVKVNYTRNAPAELRLTLQEFNPDLIITNIHKIIDEETLQLFPQRFINLHYSLLPAFGGMIGMQTLTAAKKQNVGFIGATCHYVSPDVDAGLIISQSSFASNWNEPVENLMEINFRSACLILISAVIIALKLEEESSLRTKKLDLMGTEVHFNPAILYDYRSLIDGLWFTSR